MTGQDVLDAVRSDNDTALSRIGSSKMLYALTGGEMEADAIATAAATEATLAHETFGDLADAEDGITAETLRSAVEAAGKLLENADADPEDADPAERPMYATLAGLESKPARLGGVLGYSLVTYAVVEQMVGFYVGNADPTTASAYRGIKDEMESLRKAAVEGLDAECDDDDWEAAESAATDTVQAAYDHYVETLESMGIQPKNVC